MGPSFAGILGSLAFVVILVRGAIHCASAGDVLFTSVLGLAAFALAGFVAGQVADQAIVESVTKQFHDELLTRETKKVESRGVNRQ